MTIITQAKTKVVNAFVPKNVRGCCLASSIILKEILDKKGIKSTIKQGYLTNGNYASTHYYLEVNEDIIDVGTEVFNRLVPNGPSISAILTLCNDIPDDTMRMDMETLEEIERTTQMIQMYKDYLIDPKSYWNKAPHQFLRMRKKLLRS